MSMEGLEEDFSEIKRVVRGYLNSSPSHSGSLNGSRTTPTGQSAIKEQSERLKEEISRREHELKKYTGENVRRVPQNAGGETLKRASSEGTRSGR